MTRVSVIIPCYRDAATLGRALDSVYAQTRCVDEVLVVNDCSPESEEIEAVLSHYPKVVYIRNHSNLGLAASRNVGVHAATGEILSFLDADDELHPQKIEFQLGFVGQNAAVSCGVQIIHGGQRPFPIRLFPELGDVRKVNSTRRMELSNFLTGASLMAPKQLIERVGSYDESLRSCEDFDLWFRLVEHEVEVFELRMPLYLYFFNPSGLSKNALSISQWEIEVLKRHFKRKSPEISSLREYSVWALWMGKHFLRAEIAESESLRKRTLENAPMLISWRLLANLVVMVGRARLFWPYARIRQCLY